MPRKHILETKLLKSIARRQDNDDVLFELENDKFKYAVVHLTWAQKTLIDNHYPTTQLYNDWKDLYVNRILLDNKGWEE